MSTKHFLDIWNIETYQKIGLILDIFEKIDAF